MVYPTQASPDPRLAPLRDVAGVLGSFAFDRAGELTACDLPTVFDPELLREVGPRILRLEETLASGLKGPRSLVLRFSDQRIHVRFFPECALGVLTTHDVNAAMLKMALTLTGRRLEGESPARESVPPLTPATAFAASPRVPSRPDASRGSREPDALDAAQAVLYRGRRLQPPR